jgi:flagellin
MSISSINDNIPSRKVDRELSKKTNELRKNFESLSSGKRVNSASDDPAGLAVALDLLTDAAVSDVGSRNISDAVSAANIADGSLQSATEITTRLSELATQASNGTLSDSQRGQLNKEYQSLRTELDRISQTTEFNGQKLLNGSTSISVQAGTDSQSTSQLAVNFPGVSSSSLGLSSDISTQAGAKAAIDEAKAASETIASARGTIGADVSRLDTALENIASASINLRDAASQILDADIAETSAKLTANKIGQQAAIAIKAQANIQPENVLKLLQ